jgi:hypothetical protein
LERKTLALTNSIRDNSRPRPLNLTAKEDRVFRKEYFRLQRELFNLMLLKTQLGNQSLGGQNANKMPKTKPIKSQPAEQTWRRFLFFKKKNKSPSEAMSSNIEEETVPLISIKDWEIRLYPAETIELEQIGKDLVRARIRNRETKEYMEALKENRSSFCDTIQKQIKRLEDAKRSAKVNYEKVIFQRSHYMRALRQQSDSIQSDIREGFNLGIFFRSKVGSDFIPFIEDYAQDANFKIIESKIPDTTKVTQNNQIEDLNPTENE